MATFVKTYIIDAPWRLILLYGLFYAVSVGGPMILIQYKTTRTNLTGNWYAELGMWFAIGIFVKYTTWRGEGYLERKNQRWKAKKRSSKK